MPLSYSELESLRRAGYAISDGTVILPQELEQDLILLGYMLAKEAFGPPEFIAAYQKWIVNFSVSDINSILANGKRPFFKYLKEACRDPWMLSSEIVLVLAYISTLDVSELSRDTIARFGFHSRLVGIILQAASDA